MIPLKLSTLLVRPLTSGREKIAEKANNEIYLQHLKRGDPKNGMQVENTASDPIIYVRRYLKYFEFQSESVSRRGKVCASSAEAHATNCHMAGRHDYFTPKMHLLHLEDSNGGRCVHLG